MSDLFLGICFRLLISIYLQSKALMTDANKKGNDHWYTPFRLIYGKSPLCEKVFDASENNLSSQGRQN